MSENVTGRDLQHPTHVFAYAKAAVGREYAYRADTVLAKAKATVDMLVLSVNSYTFIWRLLTKNVCEVLNSIRLCYTLKLRSVVCWGWQAQETTPDDDDSLRSSL